MWGSWGRKSSLGPASWKSVPLIWGNVLRSRWEAGLRNELWAGKRAAEASIDGEGLWLGPEGREEGSGEGIKRSERSPWARGGCASLTSCLRPAWPSLVDC